MRAAIRFILRRISNISQRIAWQRSDRVSIGRFEIRSVDVGGIAEEAVATIAEAIAIIGKFDARLLRRLEHDLYRIGISSVGFSYYSPELNVFVFPNRLLHVGNATAVAGGLVHLATRARLWRCGFRNPAIRKRIDHICVSAEIRLLERVPNSEHLVTDRRRGLLLPSPNLQNNHRVVQTAVVEYGFPKPIARAIVALHGWLNLPSTRDT